MELTQGKSTPTAITMARHITAMGIVALANPFIYYDSSPVEVWAMTLFGAVGIASAMFFLLVLIQPQRAKMAFPMTPIKSAWLILALMLFSNWQDYRAFAHPDMPKYQPTSESVEAEPRKSQIEEIMRGAPPQKF